MRAWQVALGAVAILIVSLLAAAWWLPARLDPAQVRAAMEQAASERLRATVTIDGAVRFALLPRPVLEATRVSLLHGVPGDADALAVTADTLTVRLDAAALWHGRFAASDLTLDGAQVQAPLPFDIRVLTVGRPDSLRSTTITLRNARVQAGALVADQVDAQLVADRDTGDVALSGRFRLQGGSAWRAGLRLSRPGGDGSAALDATLDELYAADGMTARLTGQLAGDGGFAGQIVASGPSLGHLLPAPPVPFEARGRATLAGGLFAVDDLALSLDHVASRLDGTWRLPPQPRLDLRLVAGRVDLDPWLRALHGAALPPLPLGLDLAAESAALAGGVLRQVRCDMALDGGRLTLRRATAVLPGDMSVQATGTAELAAFTSQFDVRVDGADLRATAAWLDRAAGRDISVGVSPDVWRTLSGTATIALSGHEIEAHDIAATLDGVGLRGEAVLSLPPASTPSVRPEAAAILSLDRLDLAPFLAHGGADVASLNMALKLTTPQLSWPGMPPASLDADVTLRAGAWNLRHLNIASRQWTLQASGRRAADGRWSDAAATIAADHADRFLPLLPLVPPDWLTGAPGWPVMVAQPLHATFAGSGSAAAPSGTLTSDLGALHMEATGGADPGSGPWRGTLALRDPNARGLAALTGHDFGFLGDGSLSASFDVAADAGVLSADNITLHAGSLDVGGELRLTRGAVPELVGRISARALPLPALDPYSSTPLPLVALRGWRAAIDLDAAKIEGLGADLSNARLKIVLADGALRLNDVSATLTGNGRVDGIFSLDAREVPPLASARMAFSGMRLAPPAWHPLTLSADGLFGTLRLQARGFAPATLLATLHGDGRATAASASLIGVDAAALGDLSDAAVRAALAGGRTPLEEPALDLAIDQGLATVRGEAGVSGGGRISAGGTIDVPDGTVDLGLSIVPAISDPPRIGLTVSGQPSAASTAPALADLTRWRATRP